MLTLSCRGTTGNISKIVLKGEEPREKKPIAI
jgi:hypothetical protein